MRDNTIDDVDVRVGRRRRHLMAFLAKPRGLSLASPCMFVQQLRDVCRIPQPVADEDRCASVRPDWRGPCVPNNHVKGMERGCAVCVRRLCARPRSAGTRALELGEDDAVALARSGHALAHCRRAIVTTSTLAHAEDNFAEMVSRYRREHGLLAVKIDPQLTAIAERQAKAMAAAGVLDHSVAGSFASRISAANTDSAAENIAVGAKTWSETFRRWQTSPGHNANLLRARADSIGFAVARNENTRFKTYWAMVIAEKSPGKKRQKQQNMQSTASEEGIPEQRANTGALPNPVNSLKNFVCKDVC